MLDFDKSYDALSLSTRLDRIPLVAGFTCIVSHYRSSDDQIVCETPNIAPKLDGQIYPKEKNFCEYRSKEIWVYVDGVGGEVNAAWNTGECTKCAFRQGWGATTQIQEVTPSSVKPGSVVTVKGE